MYVKALGLKIEISLDLLNLGTAYTYDTVGLAGLRGMIMIMHGIRKERPRLEFDTNQFMVRNT